MTHHALNLLNTSLVALPIAVAYTRRLLLAEKSSASAKDPSPGETMETVTVRANHMSSVLRKFETYNNYRHFGINE